MSMTRNILEVLHYWPLQPFEDTRYMNASGSFKGDVGSNSGGPSSVL